MNLNRKRHQRGKRGGRLTWKSISEITVKQKQRGEEKEIKLDMQITRDVDGRL